MDNIFNWFKNHKRIAVILFVIFFVVIPLLPFVKSKFGIFDKEDAIIFLTYYGTVMSGLAGGLLTLFGVWWTIKDQHNLRLIDEIKQEENRKYNLSI